MVFFSSKQQKGDSVENFYGPLNEQAENCSLADEKTMLISDVFMLNMQDQDTQRELLKETVFSLKMIKNSQNDQQAYFSTLDLKYAYSQLQLHKNTAKHCFFNIICGESTGSYRLKTEFYGLTDMHILNTYCFLDDIINVSAGSEYDHLSYFTKRLKKLNEENLRINLPKGHFAKTEIEWLGYKIYQTSISTLETKTAAISSKPPPSTLNRLRSVLGSVHYISKFIPHLAQLCNPLRQLLKKSSGLRNTQNISIS